MKSALESDTVNYSTLRRNFAAHLRQCAKFGKRFTIVRGGAAEGMLVSVAEWDQLRETIAILSNPALMKRITRGEKDIRAGRVQELRQAFKELLAED